MNRSTAIIVNTFALYLVAGVLLAAFALQVWRNELPCPLCLLQRALVAGLAIGPVLNLRHGPRPGHYAFSMLAALAGAAVSIRQILLHIMPKDPGYGSPFYGYHYYTWTFLIFAAALVLIALMLLWDRQFQHSDEPERGALASLGVWLVIALVAANVISTLLMCGFEVCADNPVRYEWLQRR